MQIFCLFALRTQSKRGVCMQEKINKKLFLYYYSKLRNVKEAAIKAGIPVNIAFSEGMKILLSRFGKNNLNKIKDQTSSSNDLIKAGLERLAFGNINDAVKLAFSDEGLSEKQIEVLDLFNVSEIKRVKGGGVEIKLFDRQKALEKLWEIENTSDLSSSAESFYKAIVTGADAIDNSTAGDD